MSDLARIGKTLRHAQATRRTETDSWLNAYQDDVRFLLERVLALEEVALRAREFERQSAEGGTPQGYERARSRLYNRLLDLDAALAAEEPA